MTVPTYDELLARNNIKKSTMREAIEDKHLIEFSLSLDAWKRLARHLGMPDTDIESIKSHENEEERRDRMLKCWKERCGSYATYEELVKVLLRINRTDLAEKVVSLRQSTSTSETKTQPNPSESHLALSPAPSQASSTETEDLSSTVQSQEDKIPTLQGLEEEFYKLMTFVEDTLKNNEVNITTITRRFRMLPQSVKRRQETDNDYKETRRRILNSTSIKDLFDNLTELKHWNYMSPDVLTHIVQDVKVNGIHQKIEEYKKKLSTFKANTKLRDLTDKIFQVPDYCIELTVKVEGWEDKTIEEAEMTVKNLIARDKYCDKSLIGLKNIIPGCLKITFILLETIKLGLEILQEDFKTNGMISMLVDGDVVYNEDHTEIKVNKQLRKITCIEL